MQKNTIVRWFVMLFISLVIIAVLVWMIAMIDSQGMEYYSGSSTYGILFVSVLSIFLLLGFIYVSYRFARWFFRLIGKLAGFSGDSIPVRLISLGLVTLIFPRAISQIFIAPVRFFINMISSFIGALNNGIGNLVSSTSDIDFALLIRLTLNTLRDSWGFFNKAAPQLLYDLQIPGLILAIAVWVMVGQVLSFIIERQSGQTDSPQRLVSFFQNIKPVTRQHVLLTLIFVISAYLSIASMVAIPWLKQGDSLFKEDWQASLEKMAMSKESFDQTFGQDVSGSPLNAMSDSFFVELLAQDSSAQWKKLVEKVRLDHLDLQTQRSKYLRQWYQIRDEAWNQHQKLLNSAINSYRDNMARMGPQEQAYYYREISRWLRFNVEKINNFLKSYRAYIKSFDDLYENWVNDANNALAADLTKIITSVREQASQGTGTSYFETNSIYSPYNSIYQAFSGVLWGYRKPDMNTLPDPPQPGSQWGIFGMISGWLLKTQSYALILITGMLGFGLFGSVISSFVREYRQRQQGEPYIKDLPSAVIRGLSAAVVEFLAVQGGLAVFTTQEVEPNSYVLFFTCLVGAVFSENIWDWAQEQLQEKFSTDSQDHPGGDGEVEGN